MHTAARWSRLRPFAIFTLALTLGSLAPLAAFGQDAAIAEKKSVEQEIQELVADLETRRADLEELTAKVSKNPDRAAAVMMEKELSERRARYRRDVQHLVELVVAGKDAGAAVAQGRATATELLEVDEQAMRKKMEEVDARILELVDTADKGNPEESDKARSQLVDDIPVSARLIKYLDANIDQRKQLGLDVEADTAYLLERVQTRSDVTAGLLQNAKSGIDDIMGRPGSSEDADAQKQLAALKEQRDVLAESQRLNVSIMDEHGIDTAGLKQGLIGATGKLSQDILDKDVATGLAEAWFADTADWVRSNGTSLVFQMLSFVLVLLAFWVVARIARGAVRRGLERSKLRISSLARDFFIKMTGLVILVLGLIIAIAQLGVEVGPLLAGLGIVGFVIGFALQDTLSNFASGLMILLYRPFDVGDLIEAGGVMGKVDKMNLVSTMVLTLDNQLLVVPNKQIWGGVIRNVTHQTKRRIDMKFGIGYSDDIPKAEKVLTEIATSHEKVLKDPEPVVRLHELGDSSVNFVVRPWSKTEDYWDVYWDITREVKQRFDAEGISIPFPQRDVHVYREDEPESAPSTEGGQRATTPSTAQTVAPSNEDDT
ncbi:MAG: mechanosensitive ion channel [Deltaproteobacteria bacterium]|nr:mechanosensitive ion channel [Deltaproteobacteria bacterium]